MAFVFQITAGFPVSAEIDYDAQIKQLEANADKIREENKKREALIDSYANDVTKQEQLISEIEKAIAGVQKELDAQVSLIKAQQAEVDAKIAVLNNLNDKITETLQDIENRKVKIAHLEDENRENLKKFGSIARAMYMTNGYDAAELLAGSKDFFDLLIRSEVMKNVSERNLEFMENLRKSVEEQREEISRLDAQTKNLEIQQNTAKEEKAELEKVLANLDAAKAQYQSDLSAKQQKLRSYSSGKANLNSQINNLKSQISASQAEIDAIDRQVAETIRAQQAARLKESEELGETEKVYSPEGFTWPLDGKWHLVTTYFGYDEWRSGNHKGVDIGDSGIAGTPIYAAQSGTVLTAYNDGGYHGGYGNYVVIDHGGGISTLYAHGVTGGIAVKAGDNVTKGQVISHVGATGWATGPHLHFEVRKNGTAVNPFGYKYENTPYFG
jgi:murein DD-endopeptidase MepM/ murein hydrolase activator NlpD